MFDFDPLDFPKIVKYKKRKNSNKHRTIKGRETLIGRTYKAFIDYTSKNPDLNIVEMDTVEGLQTELDYLLTLFLKRSHFMLIFKLKEQTTAEVTKIFALLQTLIPYDDYKTLLLVIFTDNGHEFFDVLNIECNHKIGEQVSKVFYCDPSASWQKGGIEKIMNLLDTFCLKVLLLKISIKKTVI